MKQHGDGLLSSITGANVPWCSGTLYVFSSNLATISTKHYAAFVTHEYYAHTKSINFCPCTLFSKLQYAYASLLQPVGKMENSM